MSQRNTIFLQWVNDNQASSQIRKKLYKLQKVSFFGQIYFKGIDVIFLDFDYGQCFGWLLIGTWKKEKNWTLSVWQHVNVS